MPTSSSVNAAGITPAPTSPHTIQFRSPELALHLDRAAQEFTSQCNELQNKITERLTKHACILQGGASYLMHPTGSRVKNGIFYPNTDDREVTPRYYRDWPLPSDLA